MAEMLLALPTAAWISNKIRAYATLECLKILINLISVRNAGLSEIYRTFKMITA